MTDDLTLPPDTHDDSSFGYSLFDESNPRSLINIAPDEMRPAMRVLPRELLLLEERELKRKAKPTSTVNYIRLNFWLEYERAQDGRKAMKLTPILRGVSHREFFTGVILTDPNLLAWVITPPTDYALVQRDILDAGLERLKQAIKVKFLTITEKQTVDKNGNRVVERTTKPNIAAIAEVRKIVEVLADRVQGSVVQRVAIKAQTHAHHTGLPAGEPSHDIDAVASLDKSLRQIEKQLNAALALPEKTERTVLPALTPTTGEIIELEPGSIRGQKVEMVVMDEAEDCYGPGPEDEQS